VGPILALAYHPNGETFAAGGANASITIWQPGEAWRLSRPKGEADLDLSFIHEVTQFEQYQAQGELNITHPDSGYSARAGCAAAVETYEPCPEGFVQAFEANGQRLNLEPAEITNWPDALTFNSDGTKLAVAACRSETGNDCPQSGIWIWSLPHGTVKSHLTRVARIGGLMFSPNDRYLAYGGEGREIMLFDLNGERETALSLLNLPGQITDIAFSPDGSLLTASAAFQDPGPYANTINHSRIMVWETASGQVIAHGDLTGATAGELGFSEDGRLLEYFILEGIGDAFNIWTLGIDQWQELACRIANRNLTESEWGRYVIGEEYRQVCP
jgi:WD40 repeat protein